MLWSCHRPGHDDSGAQTDSSTSDTARASYIALSLAAEANPLIADAVVTMDGSATVGIEFWNDDVGPLITLPVVADGVADIAVVGLRAESTYTMKAVATLDDGSVLESDEQTFQTGALPVGLATFTVEGDGAANEITIFGPATPPSLEGPPGPGETFGPYLVGVDGTGHVVWFYNPDDVSLFASINRSAEPLADGNLMLQLPDGFRIITPWGDTVRELTAADLGLSMLHHDSELLPNGNALVLTQERRMVKTAFWGGTVEVAGDHVLEVDADKDIVWEWSAFDHLDTERWPGALSQLANDEEGIYDWTHTNAVYYDAATDQVILSMRHQNWVLAIDHATGDIAWKLGADGDFALTNGEWFTSQHAATISGDRVLLYDNGNEKPVPYSRAVEYTLDLGAMTATQSWEWVTGTFTENLGDADRLSNGNILVCAAGQRGPDVVGQLAEVRPDAEPDWKLDIKSGEWVFRVARVEWAQPVE